MEIVEVLKRCEVFLGLDNSELRKIADLPSTRGEVYQAQDVIFRAGDRAKDLYVLGEGQVNLVVKVPRSSSSLQPPEDVTVNSITKGGVFGWSALVPPHILIMSAICRQPSKVVAISGAELYTLFEQECHLGYETMKGLVRIIGARLRDVEQLLATGKRFPFL